MKQRGSEWEKRYMFTVRFVCEHTNAPRLRMFLACNIVIDIARNAHLYVTKTSKWKTPEDAVFAQDDLLMKDQRKWRGARGDDWHPHTGSLCSNLRQPQPPCSAVKRINCRDRTWLFANRHVNYYRGRHFVQTMATLWVFCFLCLQNMPVPSACIVYQTRIHTRLESSSTKKLIFFIFCFLAQHYRTGLYKQLWLSRSKARDRWRRWKEW